MRAFGRPRAALLAAALSVVLLALWGGYLLFQQQGLSELRREGAGRLSLFVAHLRGVLARYDYLPRLLAEDETLLAAIADPTPHRVAAANALLATTAQISGASDVYLLNAVGTTLAASNWNLPHSFVGRNYGFRPYFRQALGGGHGRYFALGTRSGRRGYYFSYPLSAGDRIGVVVVKTELHNLERAWTHGLDRFLVSDGDGVIFLATRPDWRYRSLQPLPAATLATIRADRRYPDIAVEPLDLVAIYALDGFPPPRLLRVGGPDGDATYLQQSRAMPAAGWTAHVFSDTRRLHGVALLKTLLAALLALAALLLLSLFWANRQRRLALQSTRDQLEIQVERRTRELRREIDERNRAEQDLRRTQDELIHAAKMAGLGQISAGISHELNQPLTAIRSYADNARRLLERGDSGRLRDNLDRIVELTGNAASVIALLRGFARRSSGEFSDVALAAPVAQAVELFRQNIDKGAVDVVVRIPKRLRLRTDPLLLNQVLVNLLSNALHAVANRAVRRVVIDARAAAGRCTLRVSDSGPGIAPDHLANVFDPFFTTKDIGAGLGLGLAISYRITQSLGGDIRAGNAADGGAVFTVSLPLSGAAAAAPLLTAPQ